MAPLDLAVLDRIENALNILRIRAAGHVQVPQFDKFDDETLVKMILLDAASLLDPLIS